MLFVLSSYCSAQPSNISNILDVVDKYPGVSSWWWWRCWKSRCADLGLQIQRDISIIEEIRFLLRHTKLELIPFKLRIVTWRKWIHCTPCFQFPLFHGLKKPTFSVGAINMLVQLHRNMIVQCWSSYCLMSQEVCVVWN